MHKVPRYFRSGVPQKLTSAASSNGVSSTTSRGYISELVVGSKARSLSSSDDRRRISAEAGVWINRTQHTSICHHHVGPGS